MLDKRVSSEIVLTPSKEPHYISFKILKLVRCLMLVWSPVCGKAMVVHNFLCVKTFTRYSYSINRMLSSVNDFIKRE